MLPTYSAVLHSNHLIWDADSPPDGPVRVYVTVVDPIMQTPVAGSLMISALEALAATGGPSGFGEPTEWQRQTRVDRQLPGQTE